MNKMSLDMDILLYDYPNLWDLISSLYFKKAKIYRKYILFGPCVCKINNVLIYGQEVNITGCGKSYYHAVVDAYNRVVETTNSQDLLWTEMKKSQ